MEHKNAIFGIYRNIRNVDVAYRRLLDSGFRRKDIRVKLPTSTGPKDFAYILRTNVGFGARLGGGFGALVGATAALIVFPSQGVGLMLILGAFLGFVIGAACGALVGIGTPERAPYRYSEYLDDGGTLISVRAEDPEKVKLATEIFESTGAADISPHDEEATWKATQDYSHSIHHSPPPTRV